jgi:hypothetical protein
VGRSRSYLATDSDLGRRWADRPGYPLVRDCLSRAYVWTSQHLNATTTTSWSLQSPPQSPPPPQLPVAPRSRPRSRSPPPSPSLRLPVTSCRRPRHHPRSQFASRSREGCTCSRSRSRCPPSPSPPQLPVTSCKCSLHNTRNISPRQDEPKEVHDDDEVGSKRPSSRGTEGHVVWWIGRIFGLLCSRSRSRCPPPPPAPTPAVAASRY